MTLLGKFSRRQTYDVFLIFDIKKKKKKNKQKNKKKKKKTEFDISCKLSRGDNLHEILNSVFCFLRNIFQCRLLKKNKQAKR